MPRSLDLDRLKQFDVSREVPDSSSHEGQRWPSREPIREGQISIKAPLDVIDRFRRLCKDDRRTYADMLSILMDRLERRP